jgi:hypothetical protein
MKSEVVNQGSEILERIDWRSEVIGVSTRKGCAALRT